ncbi:hypothetical protein FRC11_000178, partial [Ceratobasidium sp. 423]
ANAMIGLERYLPASKALYNSIIANIELNFPFILDSHEREIVNHRGASIVVGRSGTGKTTALIYKMRAINQKLAELEWGEKRQLFVTRSPVLARHVESSFRGLIDSANIANKTPEELAEMARSSKDRSAPALVEFDSEVDLRKDLPSRYSLLKKGHFPLFVSFEKLCSLVEADLLRYEKLKQLWKQQDDLMVPEEALELEAEGRTIFAEDEDPFRELLLRRQDRRLIQLMEEKKYISYSDFKERYWPQFKRIYKPEITPALVYSEILGVIKGSSESMSCPKRHLSKDQYLGSMVRRVSAQLDVGTREQIYTIFEQYKRLASISFELDVADRTHSLLEFADDIHAIEISNDILYAQSDDDSDSRSDSDDNVEVDEGQGGSGEDDQEDEKQRARKPIFNSNDKPKLVNDLEIKEATKEYYEGLIKDMALRYQRPVGYLYVDEVQDNLMVDVQLLGKLCANIRNTYWGGDTAQTIVAGSAFRIKELGAHLYQSNELEKNHTNSNSTLSQFQLTINFRGHNGIVQCAASIVQKLYELFPHSLDKMDPETGRTSGSLPVVFTDASSDIFLFEQFLLKSSPSSNTMFGAQQAILVRSDVVAEELNSTLSELCPVITIADSKGLEFEDILVYNFFSTSDLPLDAWDFVHGHSIKTHRSQRESAPPPSLCNDLKLLYVALTRARKRCWIWDHGYVVDAMKLFWLSQDLVTTASISEMTGWNTVASTPAQWIEKGREYFANANYKLARGCFLRGEDELQANIAEAYHQMSRAKLEAARDATITDESKSKLHAAAEKLKSCARASDDRNARHLWFHAGNCLEMARKINEASEAYVYAELYERAVRLLLGKGRYRRAVSILLSHKDQLETDVREDILDQCRVHYIQVSDYDSLRPLFKDTGELLAFTINRGYHSQYTTFLECNQKFYQLAQLYLKQNSPVKALDYLLKEFNLRRQSSTLTEAAKLVISQAEWVLALDRSHNVSTRIIKEMMEAIDPLAWKLGSRSRKEAMLSNPPYLRMADEWKTDKPDDQLWRARILHSVLKDSSWLVSHFESGIMQHLDAWRDYLSILAPVIEAKEPSRLGAAQRLIGFKPLSTESLISSRMIVAEWSIIAAAVPAHKVPTQRNQYGELLVSASWVDRLVKSELVRPLKKQLFDIYLGLERSGLASLTRFTPLPAPTNIPHYITQAVTSDSKYSTRIRVTTTAIQAFSLTRRIPCAASSLTSSLLYRWVRRLFDVLYPSNGMMEEPNTISYRPDSLVIKSLQACIQELVQPSTLRVSMNTTNSAPIEPDFSTLVIGHSLILHFPLDSKLSTTNSPLEIAEGLTDFFDWGSEDGLTRGISVLRNALKSDGGLLDAVVMVHFIEVVTSDLIYHFRKATSDGGDGLSGLILPFSWARALAKRYNGSSFGRNTACIEDFLSLINMLSNQLQDEDTNIISSNFRPPEKLLKLFETPNSGCGFKRLTENEWKEWTEKLDQDVETGKIKLPTRKTRSDAGKKRNHETLMEGDEEADSSRPAHKQNIKPKPKKVRFTSILLLYAPPECFCSEGEGLSGEAKEELCIK